MNFMEMLYKRIRELREERDMSQQQMADLLFINRRTYSSYETGVRSMSPEMLVRIAQVHQVSVDYLLNLTDELGSPKCQGNAQQETKK